MKKLLLISMMAFGCLVAVAQKEKDEEDKKGGFKKDLLFTGGGLNLSFFYGTTYIGVSPQLGYSVTNWLDAGVLMSYSYISQRDDYNNKLRQSIFAPGAFVRIFPIDYIFVTAQFEHSFIRFKDLPAGGGSYITKYGANSMLLGAGYTSGKEGRNSPYYFFSIAVDVLGDIKSPYRDQFNNMLPVVIAGLNIPLFQGSRGR